MVAPQRKIIWDNSARDYLRKAISYIRKDSPMNAEMVKDKIFTSIRQLTANPNKHPPDKFRLNNNGSNRAYEVVRFRIAYYISDEIIFILRIRHVSMEPLDY